MSIRIPCYLALTAAEFSTASPLPEKVAYMACHYACYGTGLSNLPQGLPPGSLIILNDRTPADRHDPNRIAQQMLTLVETQNPYGILLDFQRPNDPVSTEVARILTQSLSCPVAVTLPYGKDLSCPLFLPPPPLHIPMKKYLAPYHPREIWLEVAPETRLYTITKEGCHITETENDPLPSPVFPYDPAFCHYHTETDGVQIQFTLQRTYQDMENLIDSNPNITCAVGLYQQLRKDPVG